VSRHQEFGQYGIFQNRHSKADPMHSRDPQPFAPPPGREPFGRTLPSPTWSSLFSFDPGFTWILIDWGEHEAILVFGQMKINWREFAERLAVGARAKVADDRHRVEEIKAQRPVCANAPKASDPDGDSAHLGARRQLSSQKEEHSD
jgi:hypothetical protein